MNTPPSPQPSVQVRILDERMRHALPRPATAGSAGLDLCACIDQPIEVLPGTTVMIPTGLAICIGHPGWAGLVLPRSGLGHRHGIVLGNLVGLIDSDYQGPLTLSCWNRISIPYVLEPMMRLAQLVVVPVIQPRLEVVEAFSARTARGTGGFGSTGLAGTDVAT